MEQHSEAQASSGLSLSLSEASPREEREGEGAIHAPSPAVRSSLERPHIYNV